MFSTLFSFKKKTPSHRHIRDSATALKHAISVYLKSMQNQGHQFRLSVLQNKNNFDVLLPMLQSLEHMLIHEDNHALNVLLRTLEHLSKTRHITLGIYNPTCKLIEDCKQLAWYQATTSSKETKAEIPPSDRPLEARVAAVSKGNRGVTC